MNLDLYIELIRKGEVVAFPTETVYGLGADAWNASAIKKVFAVKGRPSDNPLIVHVSSTEQIHQFAQQIPENAHILIQKFWPGPLSLVLSKKNNVLDAVTAGLNSVAIRMPSHPIALEFITNTGPLVAPSANTSGRPSPTKAEHVRADFGADFPIIDGDATKVGLESTVLDLTDKTPAILRPGSISRIEIEGVLGEPVEEAFFNDVVKPRSPGQKYSHYKPNAEVRWLNNGEQLEQASYLYLVHQSNVNAPNVLKFNNLYLLARELYDCFRKADLEQYTEICIEPFNPRNSAIGPALLNRIEKAIGK